MINLKDYSINEGFLRKNLGLGSVKFLQDWLEKNKFDRNPIYKINDNGALDVDLSEGRFVTELFKPSYYSNANDRYPATLTMGEITGSNKFKLVLKNPQTRFEDPIKSKLLDSIKCDNICLDGCRFDSDTINKIFNNHKFTDFEIAYDSKLKNLVLTGNNNKLKTLNINSCPNLTNIDFDLNLSNKCVVKINGENRWSSGTKNLIDITGKVKGCEKVFILYPEYTLKEVFGDDPILETDFFQNLLNVFIDAK